MRHAATHAAPLLTWHLLLRHRRQLLGGHLLRMRLQRLLRHGWVVWGAGIEAAGGGERRGLLLQLLLLLLLLRRRRRRVGVGTQGRGWRRMMWMRQARQGVQTRCFLI